MYVHEHSLLYLTLIIVEFNVHLNVYRAYMLKCCKAHLAVFAQYFRAWFRVLHENKNKSFH